MADTDQITELLIAWSQGDQAAQEALYEAVYPELRRKARNYMRREKGGHLLQTTALVNEAFVRLVNGQRVDWRNRAHFFAISALAMRRILVDMARREQAEFVPADEAFELTQERPVDLLALDDALRALAEFDQRKSRIVELSFFGGLTQEEIATVLDLSVRQINREWQAAKAWLYHELKRTKDEP